MPGSPYSDGRCADPPLQRQQYQDFQYQLPHEQHPHGFTHTQPGVSQQLYMQSQVHPLAAAFQRSQVQQQLGVYSYRQTYGNQQSVPHNADCTSDHEEQKSYTYHRFMCTPRRKALLIGINYFGQRGPLRGCTNDVRNMASYLNEHFGYKRENMVMLTDDQQCRMSIPTKQNILRAMHWLVKGAQPDDSLFLYYSGHGRDSKDLDAEKADGHCSIIYPVDFRHQGDLTDEELYRIMVQPLQAGVRLTTVFDFFEPFR